MKPIHRIVRSLACIAILWTWHCEAQSPKGSTNLARKLDSFLQDYAFGAFAHPRTGTTFDGILPSNFSGIKVAVIRLRSGSLRTRGVHSFKEFDIPTGVVIQPYVKRLAFVYENLGNWSSFYYPLPGYTYLAPVLGILAYSAANLSATNLPELDIVASSSPISIKFTDVRPAPSGFIAKCVWFNLNGSLEFSNLVASNVCSTFHQGHFTIAVNSTAIATSPAPAPAPAVAGVPRIGPTPSRGHKSKVWKIVGSVVGGFVGLLLLALVVARLVSYRKKKEIIEMQKMEDAGEVLQMGYVGNTRLPVALMTRTQPVMESEYVA